MLAAALVCALAYAAQTEDSAQQTGAQVVETAAAQGRMLIPGGLAVGVALKTKGVLVVAKTGGTSTPLRPGDVILSVGGEEIASAKALARLVNAAGSDHVQLGVLRAGRELSVQAAAEQDETDGRRRLGVWVRDSTAGVGTLSYIDPVTQAYGALGHAIVDADTGGLLDAKDGAIMNARVVGVTKGQSGRAGELRGSFLKENEQIGSLCLNSEYGIYGFMDERPQALLYPQGLPVAARDEVVPGPATIIATVDEHGPKEYAVEITRCFDQSRPGQKGMILRVTDEQLIARTGGIVQGMSGSPIIQNGKIVGAVTHVYLSDALSGYGMYIEWMLDHSDALEAKVDQAA